MWASLTSPLLCDAGIRQQSKYEQQSQQEQDEASLEPRQLLPFLQADKQTELTTLKHVGALNENHRRLSADCDKPLKYLRNVLTLPLEIAQRKKDMPDGVFWQLMIKIKRSKNTLIEKQKHHIDSYLSWQNSMKEESFKWKKRAIIIYLTKKMLSK